MLTSCIKHWCLSGYLKFSTPHQHLCRQAVTKPVSPTFHKRPLAGIKKTATTITNNTCEMKTSYYLILLILFLSITAT